ncbi:MAG: RNA polymerase sigma-70 factor [Tannerellaceae bacterium]|nr:RNA polymerase sigma-70 factor [Tannerellaceae bacterium]
MTEKELISALKSDSEVAFTHLYDLYWPQVHHFASLYLKDKEEIKEVVQEVFIKLWELRYILREEDGLKGFLFILTRNHIFDHSHKTFNEDFYRITLLRVFTDPRNIEDEVASKDLMEHIEKLISSMPAQRQLVFNLSRKEYKTYREIADTLQISPKTVERHMHEALQYLRTRLKDLLISIGGIIFFLSHWG